MNERCTLFGAIITALTVIGLSLKLSQAENPPAPQAEKAIDQAAQTSRAVKPKPLSENTTRGLAYLVSQQHDDGGWGQGGGWRQNTQGGGRVEGENVSDPTDLGNTCIATLALIRAGNTPQHGPYANNVARAARLICQYVEKSDADSLYVTHVRDTQLQSKIGQYVDTFLAGLVLSELKGKMPGDAEKQLLVALDKTVRKIEKNQGAGGNFAGNHGWASVLSQAVCSKFINRAAQNGVTVDGQFFARDFEGSVATLDRTTGKFAAATSTASSPLETAAISGPAPSAALRIESAKPARVAGGAGTAPAEAATAPSDAGVELYFAASNASRLSDLGNSSALFQKRAIEVLRDKSSSAEEKQKAEADIKRFADYREAQQSAVSGIVKQLGDEQFIAGFGNNGGEEFLSYMNIAEMLVVKGGNEWQKWDKSMAANLGRVQNQDGSWSGNHCITGRTFCTSAALLTLMADRAPLPVAADAKTSAVK
jgi:hypothetical protein